ncbi:MAG: hypothetical protein ABIS21_06815 [Acidimicrobiales bacterium]
MAATPAKVVKNPALARGTISPKPAPVGRGVSAAAKKAPAKATKAPAKATKVTKASKKK